MAQSLAERIAASQSKPQSLAERIAASQEMPVSQRPATMSQGTQRSPGLLDTIGEYYKGAVRGAEAGALAIGEPFGLLFDQMTGNQETPKQRVERRELKGRDSAVAPDPNLKRGVGARVGEMVGGAAPLMVAGAAGAGVPALATLAGEQAAVNGYYQAAGAGADEPARWKMALGQGAVGVASVVAGGPVGKLAGLPEFFATVNAESGGALSKALGAAAVDAVQSGAVATAQVAASEAIAQSLLLHPEQQKGLLALLQTGLEEGGVPGFLVGALVGGLKLAATHEAVRGAESRRAGELRETEATAEQQIQAREAESVQRGAEKIAAFSEKERGVREAQAPPLYSPEQIEAGRNKAAEFRAKYDELQAVPKVAGESIPPEASTTGQAEQRSMHTPEVGEKLRLLTNEFMSDPDVAAYHKSQSDPNATGPRQSIPSEGNYAHQNDPDVVNYRAAQARSKSAAAPPSSVGELEAGSGSPEPAAAAPSLRPNAPESKAEYADRVFGNRMAAWERLTRQNLESPEQQKNPTYLGVEGKEGVDPALAELNRARNESEQHRQRSERFYEPSRKALKATGLTVDEIGDIVYARHAEETNALMAKRNPDADPAVRDQLSGMSNDEAAAIMERWQSDARWPEIEKVLDTHDRMVRSNLQREVSAGLRSTAEATALSEMYNAYAPLRTDVEGQAAGIGRSGVRGRETKRQLGRVSRADNPYVWGIVQDQVTTSRIERNTVFQKAAKLVESMGDTAFAEVVPQEGFTKRTLSAKGEVADAQDLGYLDRPDVVPFKRGGKQFALKFGPEYVDFAEALKGTGSVDEAVRGTLQLPIVRSLPAFSRFVKRWTTRDNPFWWPVNLVRDTISTGVRQYSERGLRFAVKEQITAAKMVPEIIRNGPLMQRYREAGGVMPTMGVEDFATNEKQIRTFLERGQIREGASKFRQFIEKANDAGENAHRLSVFKLLTDQGMSDQRAALAAAEANVNFGRKGEIAPMLDALFPFYGASMNGARALVKTSRSPHFMRAVVAMVAGGAALDQRNRLVAGTDENGENYYDKIPEYEKAGNLIWMVEGGNGAAYKIPSVPGIGWFPNIGRNLSAAQWGPSTSDQAGSRIAANLVNSLNPIGGTVIESEAGQSTNIPSVAMPAVVRPAFDVAENADFRGREIRPQNERGRPSKPGSELVKPGTNEELAKLTQEIAQAGGPDVSASDVEYLIRGYLPGVFQELARGASAVQSGEKRDIPILRRFYREDNPYFTDQKYADNQQLIADGVMPEKKPLLAVYENLLSKIPKTPDNEEKRRALKARFNRSLKTEKP